MAILTKARLSTVTETKLGYSSFRKSLNEAKFESRTLADTTVFLSHNHNDIEYVENVVVLLRKVGYKVYIDWQDTSMPPFTNAETAKKIKRKIKECKKFVLLATNNAVNSKWCNWELGYGDSNKYIYHIALFPLAENSGNWVGNEYLKIIKNHD